MQCINGAAILITNNPRVFKYIEGFSYWIVLGGKLWGSVLRLMCCNLHAVNSEIQHKTEK
jgi:hypothetical protein